MNIESLIFGIILIPWGSFLCYLTVKNFILSRKSKLFPSVIGTIQSTKIEVVRGGDDPDTYYPEIRYRYLVDDIPYEAEGIKFGAGLSYPSKDKATSIILKYPVNSRVAVYYDPQKPNISALNLGLSSSVVWWAIFGPLFLGMGLFFLLISFRVVS